VNGDSMSGDPVDGDFMTSDSMDDDPMGSDSMIANSINDTPPKGFLTDVQSQADHREIPLQRVGIKDLHLPLQILEKAGSYQSVLAVITLSVDLPRHFRGTHMSRFVEICSAWSRRSFSSNEMQVLLDDTRQALNAQSSRILVGFKYFINRRAPVSGGESCLDYNCEFEGELGPAGYQFTLGVEVPIHTLCPCSKELAGYGAHNQRGYLRARIRSGDELIWIEDVVELLEAQGSTPIYPLVKREDEKYLTEHAYDNPKFVEDVLRDSIIALRTLSAVTWFQLECEDLESIHNHSAFAFQEEAVDRLRGAQS